MEPLSILLFAVLGIVVGSFLNVCIDRLPVGHSLVSPPSHCPSCNRRLAARDLIPIVSYLSLHGRCRHCGLKIPVRILLVEIITGIAFTLLYLYFGLTIQFVITIFYFCLFLVILFIDLEHYLILNMIVYPSMVIAAALAFIPQTLFPTAPGILSAIIGGTIGLALFWLIVVISRGGMGFGDVKMAGLIGLVTGFPQVFLALFIAIILGGISAVLLLILKKKNRKEGIPFGPFLSMGAIATILFGEVILNWYLGPLFP